MSTAAELKGGMVIRIEGQIYRVLEAESKAGAAKLGGVVKTKLSNVRSGHVWEPHFRPDERLEAIELERRTLQFLFGDADILTFMNPETYEQVEIPRAVARSAGKFLAPDMAVAVEFCEGQAVNMIFPPLVEVRIADTTSAVHAQHDSTWKQATLENGTVIRVPLFIEKGETVQVDVESEEYVGRVRAVHKRGV